MKVLNMWKTVIFVSVILTLAGCGAIEMMVNDVSGSNGYPEHKESNNKVYKKYTDHQKYLSGLYNDDLKNKNIRVNLIYMKTSASIQQGYAMQYPGIKDRIVVMAYPPKYLAEVKKLAEPQRSMKMAQLYNKSYVIAVPRKYRDLIFSLKDGEPITVKGTVVSYDINTRSAVAKNSSIILFADKLEVSKRERK